MPARTGEKKNLCLVGIQFQTEAAFDFGTMESHDRRQEGGDVTIIGSCDHNICRLRIHTETHLCQLYGHIFNIYPYINKVYLRPLGVQHDCISLFKNHKIQVSLRVNQHDLTVSNPCNRVARDEIVLPTVLGQKIRFSEVRSHPLLLVPTHDTTHQMVHIMGNVIRS